MGEGRLCPFHKSVFVQAPDWMRDPGEGVVGDASHTGDGLCGNLELLRDDDRCGGPVQLQFYTVVQTALAAGASVPDGEDCGVALPGDLLYQFWGRGSGGIGLGETHDASGLYLRLDQG